MPRHVCYHDGVYFIWSTVVDAMTVLFDGLEDLKSHIKEEEGNSGLQRLEKNLPTIEEQGYLFGNLESLLDGNRAGKDETCVPTGELLKWIHAVHEDKVDIDDHPQGLLRCEDCGDLIYGMADHREVYHGQKGPFLDILCMSCGQKNRGESMFPGGR